MMTENPYTDETRCVEDAISHAAWEEGFEAALNAALAEDKALFYTDTPPLTVHQAVERVQLRRKAVA